MMKSRSLILMMAVSLGLVACDRVTAENYNKLEVGMPYSEVVSILGDPTECTAVVNTKSCSWGKDEKYVNAKIVGDNVIFLTAKGLD